MPSDGMQFRRVQWHPVGVFIGRHGVHMSTQRLVQGLVGSLSGACSFSIPWMLRVSVAGIHTSVGKMLKTVTNQSCKVIFCHRILCTWRKILHSEKPIIRISIHRTISPPSPIGPLSDRGGDCCRRRSHSDDRWYASGRGGSTFGHIGAKDLQTLHVFSHMF